LKSDLEAAVAVELWTTDERIDIFGQYNADRGVAEWGPMRAPHTQEALACAILHRVPLFLGGVSMNSLPLLGAVGICLGGAATYALLRRRESPDELERKRRDLLVQQGRIIDATVIDISDLTAEESGRPNGMQLILYKYEAAGVVYECSQDVTMLRHLVNIYDCRLGFPASVRYDPHNPGNSLIVAESWSGLRDTANSVPLHGRTGAAAPSMR
jgi:hypothetical protein